MERGSYRKNLKIDTLVRKLKEEGGFVWKRSINNTDVYCPEIGRRTLVHAAERSKAYVDKVAAEKIKSTGKKELRLLARLIQLGDPSYKIPKVKFKNSEIKFQAG